MQPGGRVTGDRRLACTGSRRLGGPQLARCPAVPDLGLVADPFEHLPDVPRVQRGAQMVREHQPGILPAFPRPPAGRSSSPGIRQTIGCRPISDTRLATSRPLPRTVPAVQPHRRGEPARSAPGLGVLRPGGQVPRGRWNKHMQGSPLMSAIMRQGIPRSPLGSAGTAACSDTSPPVRDNLNGA